MFNQKLAKILREFTSFLEMEETAFKPRAYLKAAESLESLDKEVNEIYKKNGEKALLEIAGVGRGIAEKIIEYIKTGKIKEYEKLKKKYPVDIDELNKIEGVGSKIIKLLYKNLKIKNLDELKKSAEKGALENLPHFGKKLQTKILKSIEFQKKSISKIPLPREIKKAEHSALPNIIKLKDIRGDLQIQTNWTDGLNSIEEMAEKARNLNYEYMAITDHTKSLAMVHGSDEKKLLKQIEEIKNINLNIGSPTSNVSKFKILSGAEVNILKDGSLDINNNTLQKLDFAGAAVHSHFHLSKEEQTKRLIKAMENEHIDIIFHPTARVINKRAPIELNLEKIFETAARTKTILEINANPSRLDLKEEHIKMAKKIGVRFMINTDAHSIIDMDLIKYGIFLAQKSRLSKTDVLNTLSLKEFLELIKKPKNKRW